MTKVAAGDLVKRGTVTPWGCFFDSLATPFLL